MPFVISNKTLAEPYRAQACNMGATAGAATAAAAAAGQSYVTA